jgi:hypothetical protein
MSCVQKLHNKILCQLLRNRRYYYLQLILPLTFVDMFVHASRLSTYPAHEMSLIQRLRTFCRQGNHSLYSKTSCTMTPPQASVYWPAQLLRILQVTVSKLSPVTRLCDQSCGFLQKIPQKHSTTQRYSRSW